MLIENVRGRTLNNGGRRKEGESEESLHPSSLEVETVCLGKNKGGDVERLANGQKRRPGRRETTCRAY